jgi:hypothetical protein
MRIPKAVPSLSKRTDKRRSAIAGVREAVWSQKITVRQRRSPTASLACTMIGGAAAGGIVAADGAYANSEIAASYCGPPDRIAPDLRRRRQFGLTITRVSASDYTCADCCKHNSIGASSIRIGLGSTKLLSPFAQAQHGAKYNDSVNDVADSNR